MDFSKLLQDLSKLFYVFFALCQTKPSKSLTKISKLAEASEHFELKVLNESKYSMPWVRCAFGNVCKVVLGK